ncbi:DMT family transporter [Aliarcobacter cryaerophilus]|uniref:DMT family transporter n=1 Tax=Aliarcobacter cryaerophilus TaxID=28198 RepID=UPI0021B170B5|nr:DMT family transporter [Aliarcobacter cryaerophilus]MCT7443756.1 DMT family transporter [Aliarcobacter cryaerophilus]MCT7478756.1 DMT family transporter [Aliarcobacter cryaerophilus]
MQQSTKAHIYVVIATIFIAGSFLASYKLSSTIDAISLTLYRFVLALIFLSPLVIFNKNRVKAVPKLLPKAMVISLFYSLYFIGMFKALEYTTVLNTGSIYTLVPLMTAILCIFFFKEKIPLAQLFVYIIGIISTLIVVFKANLELLLKFSLNQGDIIFLIASLSMALYSIFLKVLYKKDDDIIVLVFSTLMAGIIWMSFTMWILGIPYEWEKIEGNLLFSMLYLVVATTILTLFLYQKATLILGPKKVMAYIYISPSLVALIMFIFEKQRISLGVFIGILLSTIATIIILRQK